MNDATNAADAFDTSSFELEDFGTLHVMNARGDSPLLYQGSPVTIELYGPGSDQAVQAERRAGVSTQKRITDMMRGKAPDPKAAEKSEHEMVEKLVARTRAVNNFPVPGGARAIYANPRLNYITRQAITFMNDDANFSKASSEN